MARRIPLAPGWTLDGVHAPTAAFELRHPERGTLRISLRPLSEPLRFAQTKYFGVAYSASAPLAADGLAFMQSIVESLRETEAEHAIEADFPGLLLDRRAAEVTLYMQLHRVELRPTLACNHHCGFCNSVDRTIENAVRGTADVRATLGTWLSRPVQHAAITGGEPTLLKDLPDLIEGLASEGLVIEVQTNGMALAEPTYAERLAKAGVRVVLISLHSHDAVVSDEQITGYPQGWEKTVAGIDNALRADLKVHLSHVLHRTNRHGLPEFLRFVRDRWGRKVLVRLAFVAPTGDARENFDAQVPSLPDVLPSVRDGLAYAARELLRVRFVSYCGIPPCLLVPHESFSDVPYAAPFPTPDDHVKLDACRSCVYEDRCPGLWSEYHRQRGDPGLSPIRRRRVLPGVVRWALFSG